jgi:hypothetical protein
VSDTQLLLSLKTQTAKPLELRALEIHQLDDAQFDTLTPVDSG